MVEVWPENWPAIQFYRSFSTQWRVGPGGMTGLDYSVIQREMDRRGIAGDEYDDLMGRLRVIEGAALDEFHKD